MEECHKKTLKKGLSIYGGYNVEIKEIKAKYSRYKAIANIFIWPLSLVLSWFLFIVPQLKIEGQINSITINNIISSSPTLSINPAYRIMNYLHIDGELDETQADGELDETSAVEEVNPYDNDETKITIENELEQALYKIYYPNEDINYHWDDGTPYYSVNFKESIRKYGITQRGDSYTTSFKNLLNKVREIEQKSGSFILDCDLLYNSQEDPINLDLNIKDIKIIDDNNADITTTFSNGNCIIKRTYVMKRENGIFKIDDFIDENQSIRKMLNDEIKSTEEFIDQES